MPEEFPRVNVNIPKVPKFIVIGAGVLIALFLLSAFKPWVTVPAGTRGVLLRFDAVQDEVLDEGLHFIIPVVHKIALMDVRIQKSQTDAAAASKDLQDISTRIALNFQLVPERANIMFQNIGTRYKERIIDPAVQEVVKAVAAKFTAEELITKREGVKNNIKEQLSSRLINYDIRVTDFSIMNFQFSPQFTQAIEQKQAAEQMALKAQRDLDRIRIEAEQKIAAAQAEAEALRLQKENISPDLIKLRQIEASIMAIGKWDGHLPKVTSGAIPFIDVKSFE